MPVIRAPHGEYARRSKCTSRLLCFARQYSWHRLMVQMTSCKLTLTVAEVHASQEKAVWLRCQFHVGVTLPSQESGQSPSQVSAPVGVGHCRMRTSQDPESCTHEQLQTKQGTLPDSKEEMRTPVTVASICDSPRYSADTLQRHEPQPRCDVSVQV